MSIYEVHPGSWRQGLGWRDLADELGEHVSALGFTHVELMPVMQHPYGPSWGYQVSGYYAPQATMGEPDDLRAFVDALHGRDIGVILDWVPAHFPRDEWALARFDGTALYEHADPRRGAHPDWGTLVFNFGRHEVRNFLLANALYWLEEFHADGLRVDAVASMLYLDYSREPGEWLPNRYGGREDLEAVAFLQELNAVVHAAEPGVLMVAEESTAWPGVSRPTEGGGLGFTFKWNMGWMHDTLEYVSKEPVHRRWHHDDATFSLIYAWDENFVLPLSHDEVVHGKGPLLRKLPGDEWQQFATLRALYGHMWAHPGKQLLFMGAEIGQGTEWTESGSLDWYVLDYPLHRGVQAVRRRPEPGLPRGAGALGGGPPPRGVPVARRRRARGQRARVPPPLGGRLPSPRVPGELLARGPAPLARAAPGRRPLARGAEHGRGRVRRLRGSAISGRSTPSRSRSTGGRSPRASRCRRSRPCGSPRSAERADSRRPSWGFGRPVSENERRQVSSEPASCRFVHRFACGSFSAAGRAAARRGRHRGPVRGGRLDRHRSLRPIAPLRASRSTRGRSPRASRGALAAGRGRPA